MRRLFLVALLLSACKGGHHGADGGPGAPDGGGSGGAPCDTSSDCDPGYICLNGSVCTAGCESARDCAEPTPMCDPAAGAHGTCVACRVKDDCGAGEDCRAGVCTAVCTGSGDCETGQICVEQVCVPGCASDRDCGSQRCDLDRGEHGTCVFCLSDGDCGGGTCQPDGTCKGGSKVDILFVIDNSAKMDAKQAALADGIGAFVTALGDPLPDLHLGIVSTNLGAGQFNIGPTCFPGGDDGHLRATGDGVCAVPSDPFIKDERDPGGGRVQNYNGDLAATFACISQLGTDGCGFEQPLASVERALLPDNTFNAGFLRPDAYLAVIIFSDEDDCSAADPSVYNPNDASLGELSSFRCTQYGVTCAGGNVARGAATYEDCRPRTDSYLQDPMHTVTYLRGLTSGGSRLITAVIAGDVSPFTVGLDPNLGQPLLLPSCETGVELYDGVPGVRLKAFADSSDGSFSTICTMDYTTALGAVGGRIRAALEGN